MRVVPSTYGSRGDVKSMAGLAVCSAQDKCIDLDFERLAVRLTLFGLLRAGSAVAESGFRGF
jgi:hypothetical protein